LTVDYSLFRRRVCAPDDLAGLKFDVLISAYNESERVNKLWTSVQADVRIWINHEEYGFDDNELPSAHHIHSGLVGEGEIQFWSDLFSSSVLSEVSRDVRLAIDITGLMRPHVLALPLALALHRFSNACALYSDPSGYSGGSGAVFSKGPVLRVSAVNGFEGIHDTSTENRDVLILGAGYDDELITAVAESKRAAEQIVLVGLPSLQPHMYQESLLRLHRASESINNYSRRDHIYAPASDPFTTAGVISEHITHLRSINSDLNVYLSPVGPKTQVLGISWYYLCEAVNTSTSVIFPYAESYERETSKGIGRTRIFDLEIDLFRIDDYL